MCRRKNPPREAAVKSSVGNQIEELYISESDNKYEAIRPEFTYNSTYDLFAIIEDISKSENIDNTGASIEELHDVHFTTEEDETQCEVVDDPLEDCYSDNKDHSIHRSEHESESDEHVVFEEFDDCRWNVNFEDPIIHIGKKFKDTS